MFGNFLVALGKENYAITAIGTVAVVNNEKNDVNGLAAGVAMQLMNWWRGGS